MDLALPNPSPLLIGAAERAGLLFSVVMASLSFQHLQMIFNIKDTDLWARVSEFQTDL